MTDQEIRQLVESGVERSEIEYVMRLDYIGEAFQRQLLQLLADGNMDAVFDALKAFVEATKTRLENEALNRQPALSAGVPPTKNTTTDADMEQMRRWMGVPVRR